MSTRNHIVITGTGRAGTTFLVELLTHLGLETGFTNHDLVSRKHRLSHAGLEHDIRNDKCPFVVKSPWFSDYAEEVINRDDVVIEHIFIPFRNLHAAAESRRQISKQNVENGGLWHTQSQEAGKQEEILLNQIYKLLFIISNTLIPVTLLHYPRITNDCSYLFQKLKPALPNVSFEYFRSEFNRTVRPELVHSFNDQDC